MEDNSIVILTLSEFASIIKIAANYKKSCEERKQEIMNIYKKRKSKGVTKIIW